MKTVKMLNTKNTPETVLLIAMELSRKEWRLVLSPNDCAQRRVVVVVGGDFMAVQEEVRRSLMRFGLPTGTKAICCYEAGRDGFYPYRRLTELGYTVWVVDSASIEVNRRQRRAKSDSIDADKLSALMQRQHRGERALKIVQVPNDLTQDERQLTRERGELRNDMTRHSTRIKALAFAHGYRQLPGGVKALGAWITQHQTALLPNCYRHLQDEFERLRLCQQQLKRVEQALQEWQQQTKGESQLAMKARRLQWLKGMGAVGATQLACEIFWRHFNNRRQVGAIVGLTPTPYTSGDLEHELGISKAGNKRARWLLVELAWQWLRHQPDSVLSQWYRARFGGKGRRLQRIGIVALARKLAVALWHYLEHGVIPQGAQLKAND